MIDKILLVRSQNKLVMFFQDGRQFTLSTDGSTDIEDFYFWFLSPQQDIKGRNDFLRSLEETQEINILDEVA